MIKSTQAAEQGQGDDGFVDGDVMDENLANSVRPIPRISIQAFCDEERMAEAVTIASEDRRLAKAHVSVHMGGAQAAVAHYQESPTPNLIIIESRLPRAEIIGELDKLAESCDAGTKVLIVGHANDVLLYRELLKRGVSEYLIAPIDAMHTVRLSLANAVMRDQPILFRSSRACGRGRVWMRCRR